MNSLRKIVPIGYKDKLEVLETIGITSYYETKKRLLVMAKRHMDEKNRLQGKPASMNVLGDTPLDIKEKIEEVAEMIGALKGKGKGKGWGKAGKGKGKDGFAMGWQGKGWGSGGGYNTGGGAGSKGGNQWTKGGGNWSKSGGGEQGESGKSKG